MKAINQWSDTAVAEFEASMRAGFQRCANVLGDEAFRLPTPKTRGRVNAALAESVFACLAGQDDSWIARNDRLVRENRERLVRLPALLEAVSLATGDRQRVATRLRLARDVLLEGTC